MYIYFLIFDFISIIHSFFLISPPLIAIDVQLVSESKRIKLEKTNSTSTNPSTNSSAQNSPPSLNSPTSTQSSFISEGITRCICEFDGDDGVMIECEDCKDWFHTCCVGVDENRLPEKYICPKCQGIIIFFIFIY